MEEILEGVNENKKSVTVALSRLEEISKEIRPNGGSSLKDAVNRIDRRVAVLEAIYPEHHRGQFEETPDNS